MMADDHHVVDAGAAHASGLSISEDEEGGGTRNGQGDGGMSDDGDLGASAAATEVTEARDESTEAQPPARSLPSGSPSSHSMYPLNSRRLTAGYLRRLAKALGLRPIEAVRGRHCPKGP